ncbi:glucosaminidase domain-containing protein [Thalassospira sp.]|uniref:glucosaminidase domain-containing protein n=1 Tax=Thalassospira sp. TaxID=1912094 RepID=UPI002736CE92|nr:glucosaminidase domain-containing protein [Thalassospira sp.]MDP2699216.1 glucosaminidase domain-containing protein [Thalassospira sp.]
MSGDITAETPEQPVRAKVKKLYQRNPEVVALDQYFKSIGYTLEDATHVPRVYINRVPKGLRDLASVDERKRIFLRIMLPLSLKVNEEISANRDRLLSIRRNEYSGIAATPSEKEWIDGLMKKYRISEGGTAALLERIDVIPPSLMLAQSAEESGWGTSRFVRNGNALFGQWAWNEDEGIVPENREEGKTHVIKAFDSLMDSVRAYARNINSHPAYAGLRQARADMRASGQDITGWELATSLTQYSERGAEYVDSLHAIMKVNNLNDFDHLQFGGDDVAPPPGLLASLQD